MADIARQIQAGAPQRNNVVPCGFSTALTTVRALSTSEKPTVMLTDLCSDIFGSNIPGNSRFYAKDTQFLDSILTSFSQYLGSLNISCPYLLRCAL